MFGYFFTRIFSGIFAAPKIEKKNLVGENSKDLLQSRIAQLNNNMEYKRELPKLNYDKISNEYVNLLSNEVTNKFNNPNNMSKSIDIPRSTKDTIDSDYPNRRLEQNKPKCSDYLKPIGDCKRCNKTLMIANRITIAGQHFHKYFYLIFWIIIYFNLVLLETV